MLNDDESASKPAPQWSRALQVGSTARSGDGEWSTAHGWWLLLNRIDGWWWHETCEPSTSPLVVAQVISHFLDGFTSHRFRGLKFLTTTCSGAATKDHCSRDAPATVLHGAMHQLWPLSLLSLHRHQFPPLGCTQQFPATNKKRHLNLLGVS